jgi:outer membrane autotransporter protein
MTSCHADTRAKHPGSHSKEEREGAAKGNPSVAVTAFPISAIALAAALLASAPHAVRAAEECGPEEPGQNTVTCKAPSYSAGIIYALTDGLTVNLDAPGMVVSGKQGVAVQAPVGATSLDLTVHVMNVDSITATEEAVAVNNQRSAGLAAVVIDRGTLTGGTTTVSSSGFGASQAQVTLNGGQIRSSGTGGGIVAALTGVTSTGNSSVVINGGSVDTAGLAVQSRLAGPGATGTASIQMNGGSVLSRTSHALAAQSSGAGRVQVQMTGGTVAAPGANADGIFATSRLGTYAVDVSGGTVSGGSGNGAAVHTSAAAGGIVNIGAGATINAGASGVAFRDGDANRDGIDEIGGNVALTSAGTINGAIVLGSGTDSVTVTGGAINGNITGNGPDTLAFNLGSGSFSYGAGGSISGMGSVAMNSGTAQVNGVIDGATAVAVNGGTLVLAGANSYTGGTTINGGVLQLGNGGTSGSIVGDVANNGTLAFNRSDAVTFGGLVSGTGALTHAGVGTTALTAANSYTGATTIAAGTLALAGAGSIASSSQVIANGIFDIAGVAAAGTSVQRLSGSGAVTLGGKTLTLTAAQDTFSGTIAGTGSLAIAAGTQVLAGTNTYTGATTIASASTLQLGSGGTSGSVAGAVANEGTLVFNRANRLDLAGDISGSGVIRQAGAGMTNLTGNSAAFTGSTLVEAGTLAVNGTLGGSMNVLAAGRLQGSGAVGSTTVTGTVAPGNSIGTLAVNGSFAQLAGSTYQVEVDPASAASDLLRVSGSASLASGARLEVVRAGSGSFGPGTRYTVLRADGGVIGTYTLTGDTQSAFVRVVDSYDANHVYLLAEKFRSFTEPAATPNEAAVGGALDSLPGSNPLSTAMAWLPNDFAARDALNQLSADIHASSRTAALEDSRFVREAAIDRLRGAACVPGSTASGATQRPVQAGTGCTPEDSQARAGWAQVFGSWGSIDSDGNAAKLKRDIGGFFVGADAGIAAGWRVGALGGYSRASADTSTRNSSSKTESYHLGVYGGTQWGATALRLGVSQSWNKTDTSRSVGFAGFAGTLAGKYDSSTTQAFGELGHRIDMGPTTLEPFAGLAHVRLRSDAFIEQGGLAALYGYGGHTDATFSTIGVRASVQASESLRLRGTLGWRHAFGDAAPTTTHAFAGSVPFTMAGVPLAKNVAVLEAGVETQLRPNLALNASYSGQFGSGLKDHGFKVNLNWSF